MPLTVKEKQALKAKAHQLKPIVIIGAQGLTENVHADIERGLIDHELMKIKIAGTDKTILQNLAKRICARHQAELIQIVGHILTIYRPNDD